MRKNGVTRPAWRRTYWLITRHRDCRMEVFTTDLDGLGQALPVFGFEQEATMFLRLGTPGTGWQARETSAGELLSFLNGPCGGIKRVALDPLPQTFDSAVIHPVCVHWEVFARTLLERLTS